MLEVYDLERKKVAILENAYNVEEDKKINSLWTLSFQLPEDDKKIEYCNTFWYVQYNNGELYRIMPQTRISEETGEYTFQCEHVLATLLDNVLFGTHVVGNIGTDTETCINYILDHQLEKNWKLGVCEFTNQYEYCWENENLLSALFSIATPFADPYIWVTDTSSYPWVVNLKRIEDGLPEVYVTLKKNLLSYQTENAPEQICTRLYPLGYGEGVNQLGITDVNGGSPYVQSPKKITDKYGIIERVWIDRRYENPDSLLAAAKKMLLELQEPINQYEIGYQELNENDYGLIDVGKRLQIRYKNDIVDTIITGVNNKYEEIQSSSLKIANRSIDIASTVADLADRQRIEMAYAQGATQLYAQSLQANCDSKNGAIMSFFIPDEMRIVNSVKIKIKSESFRAYSKATSVEEEQKETSEKNEAEAITSDGGGGIRETTKDGGGVTKETGESGINVTWVYPYTYESEGHTHQYERVNSHQHEVTIPDHTHEVVLEDHKHEVTIPSHTHSFIIPEHNHDIVPGIYTFGNPKSISVKVNGKTVMQIQDVNAELDITEYLIDEERGTIPRGTWHEIEIVPNDLAYVMIDMYVQGFIQSRGDATV